MGKIAVRSSIRCIHFLFSRSQSSWYFERHLTQRLLFGTEVFTPVSATVDLLRFGTFASCMAETVTLHPRVVEYDPVTGVPSEFNEFLPKDSEEHKKWKAAKAGGSVEGAVSELTLKDKTGAEIEKRLPGGKVKKKVKAEVVLETTTRSKKKCVTTIQGLDRFGIKLGDASKLFGKKFAAGASITKSPQDVEQIEVQGDFLDKAAEFVFKQFGKEGVKKTDIFVIQNKKKEP